MTAVFLAIIALTGLVSVIIWRVPLRKTAKNTQTPQHHNDNKLQVALLVELREELELQTRLLSDLLEATHELRSASVPTVQCPVDRVDSRKTLIIEGRTYDSPKLFSVLDWLNANPDKANLSVRQIAELTGVSKSWVAIAKKYIAEISAESSKSQ